MRSVQIELIKIGARLVRHALRLVFQFAGYVPAGAGAYRRAPCSTWLANILGVTGGDEDSQGRGAGLEELEVKSFDVASKTFMIALADGGGIVERSVAPEHVDAPSVSEDQVAELAELGRRLEEHYGAPQDIEWCLEGDRLSLLQSRPIMTL